MKNKLNIINIHTKETIPTFKLQLHFHCDGSASVPLSQAGSLPHGAIYSTTPPSDLTANDAPLPGELFDSIIFAGGLQFENTFLSVRDFFAVRKNKGTFSYRLPVDETTRVASTVNEHPLSRCDLTALPDADKLRFVRSELVCPPM